ncbi:TPA: hypothetical protein PP871_001480 [Staphylococcus aureus]|nr:hypothetical protein [Staphylococcus sp. 30403_3112M30944]MBO0945702.1 hypothetical protein [Staphylococcus sp. 30402_3112M30943]MBO0963548.1 hypothetical protein [Staphylococcus sp. 30400_3112M30941]MBO0966714.1 hypothetical protein [Staphylococcus sp. 30401_3112M30942]HDJ2894982.1 hypothetical protein [Staphylococcus aureus]
MCKKTIGIIGRYGTIGEQLFELLKNQYHIIATYYSEKREDNDIYVDIYRPSTMSSFLKKCDVVVNCAGPSYIVSARLSEWMNKHNMPYIDLFGGDTLEREINKLSINVPFIINAGSQPGLSGLMVLWMAQKFEAKNSEIKIYQGGNESGGTNALLDILLSTKEGYGKSNYYIKNGMDIVNKNNEEYYFKDNHHAYAQLYFTKELERILNNIPFTTIKSYMLFKDKMSKQLLMNSYGIINQQKLSKQQKLTRIRNLMTHYQTIGQQWFVFRMEANDNMYKHILTIKDKNSHKLTALIAALCVEKLTDEGLRAGCYWACDILNPNKVVERLKLECIDIGEHVEEIVERMEEGEI